MKRAFAALVSIFIPGLGQLGLGRGKRAAVFLSTSVITFFVFWVMPLPETFAGLILGKLIAGFIATAAAIEALLLPWKGISVRNSALLVLIIPLGFWAGTVPTGIANLHHGFRAFTVTNTAMEPTLHVRDRFVTEFPKNPVHRGDVVAFKHEGVLTMKRVIGIAGDVLAGDGNKVFLNGEVLQEPYVQHIGGPSVEVPRFGPVSVIAGTLFVLGDNRDVSYDSRFQAFGLISTNELVGKVLYIYYSPEMKRIGRVID